MAGRTFTTTVSINGSIDASVQKAFTSMSQRLGAVQKAAIQTAGATDKLSMVIDNQSDELEAAKKAYTDYILGGEKSKKKANELANNIKRLASELSDNEDKMEDAKKAADKLAEALRGTGDAAEEAEDGFSIMKGAAADLVANGISNAASSLFGLVDNSKEFRTEMAKLESAFDSAGLGADVATKSYDTLYSVLGDTGKATEASMLLAQIATDEKDLDRWNRVLIGTWAEYGDSIPTEGLAEAVSASSAMSSVQGVLADALEWQGINLEDYNAKLETISSAQDRAAYIQRTLTDLYGESADAYRENNAELIESNNAANALEKAQAELGATLVPLTTKFTELKAQALGWLVDTGLPALQSGFNWIKDNIPTVVAVVGTLTAAWLTFGGAQKLVDMWNKIVTVSQKALNVVMNANPIGIIVTAVMALVTAFVYLWDNCEGFRQFWINMWENIKAAFGAAIDWIKGAFSDIANFFSETTAKIGQFFSDLWTGFIDGAKAAWEGVKNVFSKVGEFFGNIFGAVKDTIVSVFQAGGQVFLNIKDGIVSVFKTVVNGIITGINKVIALPFEGLNKILDKIHGISIAGVEPFSWLTWRAPVPQIPLLASGGFTEGVSIAGEAGTEAVISFDRRFREQNLSYWAKAGQMLGADYSDYAFGDSGGESYIDLGGVTFAPKITINGKADKESIMAAIEAEYPEFIDMLEDFFRQRSVTTYA